MTRINSISPGIIVTTLATDEFNSIQGDFYKKYFKKVQLEGLKKVYNSGHQEREGNYGNQIIEIF